MAQEDVTVVDLAEMVDARLLHGLVAHLREEQGAIQIVSRHEYSRLVASAVQELVPSLLSADASSIKATLEKFDVRFRGQADRLAHAAIEADVAQRVRKLEDQETQAGRREVMRETFFAYDGNLDADGWLGWEISFRRYMGDAPEPSPASESLRVLVAARRGSLDAVLGGMSIRARELDEEEDARRSGRVKSADNEDRYDRVAACALPDSYWPWGSVVHVVIELGPSALAGAAASQLLDASVRWLRRWLNSQEAPKEVKGATVKIYAPNGRDVLREVTVSRDGDDDVPF
jgi:hypothetical protein